MKTLVIYDSFFGNTKQVADAVAAQLGAETIKCNDVNKDILSQFELIIVGSPIRGWRPSENTMKLLNSLSVGALNGIKATAFDTRVRLFIHGDAKEAIVKKLNKLGAEIITPAEAFYVTGSEGPLEKNELERAALWAAGIK